ncbi:MAG: sodium:solute symporter [Bacteroidales bacterium]|nr:sodium:solute symporter [Bacteroidales bacterium]
MSSILVFISFALYTALLFVIAWRTSRKADNTSFFTGNRASPWFAVAYGMIGASLSGVTFISIPGWVGETRFSYLMVVLGYLLGYYAIAYVLLPMYYRLNLTSIYTYLEGRFGFWSYKTGSAFFLISRIIGASFRLFLVVNVLQIFVFDHWHIPFWATALLFIVLIWLYTAKGGIKTIVWTDTMQTTFMLLAVFISLILVSSSMNLSLSGLFARVAESDYSQVLFFSNWRDERFFLKQFMSGIFIAIVMTGLDQDMMQKNLTCRSLRDARKNIITLSWVLIPVNLLFLFLGASLYLFAAESGIALPRMSDDLFPLLAFNHLGMAAGIVFIIGLISAAYSSADSAITALTTSFSIDFLGLEKKTDMDNNKRKNIRILVHVCISFLILAVIIIFRMINDQAVISGLFTIAGYTYGPLLGMFAFGLFTKYRVRDPWAPVIAVISPVICYFLSVHSMQLFNGYRFGFELLIINGLLTFTGLWMVKKSNGIKS